MKKADYSIARGIPLRNLEPGQLADSGITVHCKKAPKDYAARLVSAIVDEAIRIREWRNFSHRSIQSFATIIDLLYAYSSTCNWCIDELHGKDHLVNLLVSNRAPVDCSRDALFDDLIVNAQRFTAFHSLTNLKAIVDSLGSICQIEGWLTWTDKSLLSHRREELRERLGDYSDRYMLVDIEPAISLDQFLGKIWDRLEKSPIKPYLTKEVDHVAFRTSSIERYLYFRRYFSRMAALEDESEIAGRPISVYRLKMPYDCFGQPLEIIELIAPKIGESYSDGYEHLAFVTPHFRKMVKDYPQLEFKTEHMHCRRNPRISLQLCAGQLHFHHTKLMDLVHSENETD